ncbi:TraH family protein (plasmid) [Rhizobium sullae]|uniref:TraH family protein n=1 Tax=Rhizobium sullae TaxID=50338 RepID=A0ABY5XYE3_RHISU|nr:TraH family protein [Rhizobium sullae]UWU19571.1 TraH family protein [Rhizobium sullae]
MVDAALIKQCSNPALRPAIVEAFIARAGSQDPLAVTVRSGNRVVLVPKPTTPDEAMKLIGKHIGRNTLRVGITQYPAGLGIMEAGALKPDLVDACANLRMGTALFARVYRIVMKWYGNPTGKEVLPEVLDDAIIAWQTGYFEGTAVFRTPDPGGVEVDEPAAQEPARNTAGKSEEPSYEEQSAPAEDPARDGDPDTAGIRIDLSGIGAK